MSTTLFTIEECGLDELWVYRVDHEWVSDGDWHYLNANADGLYRFEDDRLVFVSQRDADDREFADAVTQLGVALPMFMRGTYELEIHRSECGLHLVCNKLHDFEAPLADLSRAGLEAAFDDLLGRGWSTWSRRR